VGSWQLRERLVFVGSWQLRERLVSVGSWQLREQLVSVGSWQLRERLVSVGSWQLPLRGASGPKHFRDALQSAIAAHACNRCVTFGDQFITPQQLVVMVDAGTG
jgi:hypothetical protein